MRPMIPDLASQFRAPVLDIWGYEPRIILGFVGGPTRLPVAYFDTMDAAHEAKKAADRAVRSLPPHRVQGEAA